MGCLDLGIEWYSVVHHGTNLEKGDCFVEFKEFFSMMKNRISDSADIPYFFRDLISMITNVTEDEWRTPKDPSTKLSKDSTLHSYVKDRGLSKKFAQSIVHRLTSENFIDSLETRPATVLNLLADDFKPYDSTADASNIASKLADVFTDNIALYITVNTYVTTYYVKMREIMMNADKRGDIDYDEVQDQMHAIYKRLKKAKKTKVEIFNEIAQKIHKVSLQEDLFCQIVVSYFVQSCEVFDAIT